MESDFKKRGLTPKDYAGKGGFEEFASSAALDPDIHKTLLAINKRLSGMEDAIKGLATEDAIKGLATKEDLEKYETNTRRRFEDLENRIQNLTYLSRLPQTRYHPDPPNEWSRKDIGVSENADKKMRLVDYDW